MRNQKMKSSREMTKKLNEARASVWRLSGYLDNEWNRNTKAITAFKPVSTWGDVGDIGRALELLKDLEELLSERARLNGNRVTFESIMRFGALLNANQKEKRIK